MRYRLVVVAMRPSNDPRVTLQSVFALAAFGERAKSLDDHQAPGSALSVWKQAESRPGTRRNKSKGPAHRREPGSTRRDPRAPRAASVATRADRGRGSTRPL